ncbi:MAG TPA: ABC transporter permease [Streptosporangiales bacterium]
MTNVAPPTIEALAPDPQGRGAVARLLAQARGSYRSWFFLALLAVFALLAIMPGVFASADPTQTDLPARLLPPGSTHEGVYHLLGTDQLGRDVLSRVVYGSRVSLAISLSAVLGAGLVGSALGVVAAVLRGVGGVVVMRIADMVLSIPFFLLAILTVVVLGPSLVNVVVVLALVRWPRYARVAFAQTLETRNRDFVRSAVAIGATPWRVVLRHIVPEVIPSIVVVATLELGLMVIYEASLSFIGLGVQPPDPSWGSMLSDGQKYVSTAWWLATFPGIALFLLVLTVNMLGDFVRDQLDPSERSARM